MRIVEKRKDGSLALCFRQIHFITMTNRICRWLIALTFLLGTADLSPAYSVLTHEQLIDLSWNLSIVPLLRQRFPKISDSELQDAHAYAYGGCAIQDLGYYPFGKELFSDLTHYVRTGDFILSLLRNARNANEYAFALGALSHYVGDTIGHQDAVNPSTSLDFPKLARKFGPSMTYDENPHAHVRTEFGFDVDQLSKHRLAPGAYLRFIGLKVSRGLVERAVYETYALHLEELLGSRRPTFHTYAWAVRSFLPRVAYAEALIHRKQFTADASDDALRIYEDRLAQSDFRKLWEPYRRKPGFKTYAMAFALIILPKIGPLAEAKICIPNSETEELYIKSVNRAAEELARLAAQLRDNPSQVVVANLDLDTGRRIKPGEYPLTDQTFAKLLNVLAKHEDRTIPLELRREILAYVDDPGAFQIRKLNPARRAEIVARSAALRASQ